VEKARNIKKECNKHMTGQSRQTLTEQLKQAVAATGKSVTAVARESGVPQPVLHRFVTGERGLLLDTADRLCAYLGLHLHPAVEVRAGDPAA
jgi:plasmid maintenance system antidote protein VapI